MRSLLLVPGLMIVLAAPAPAAADTPTPLRVRVVSRHITTEPPPSGVTVRQRGGRVRLQGEGLLCDATFSAAVADTGAITVDAVLPKHVAAIGTCTMTLVLRPMPRHGRDVTVVVR
jgi:hypothetical protein